jgi:hypothetical protein
LSFSSFIEYGRRVKMIAAPRARRARLATARPRHHRDQRRASFRIDPDDVHPAVGGPRVLAAVVHAQWSTPGCNVFQAGPAAGAGPAAASDATSAPISRPNTPDQD